MPLDERQACRAMLRFLDDYWERNGRPDELGGSLGSLQLELFTDGTPADPAMWEDWLAAVNAILSEPA